MRSITQWRQAYLIFHCSWRFEKKNLYGLTPIQAYQCPAWLLIIFNLKLKELLVFQIYDLHLLNYRKQFRLAVVAPKMQLKSIIYETNK